MAMVRYDRMDGGKRTAIVALFVMSALIIATGVAFGVYSFYFHVSYTVLNSQIPGYVFAAVVVFLGTRYLKSVFKMKKTLSASAAKFDWNNFKPKHTEKSARSHKFRKK